MTKGVYGVRDKLANHVESIWLAPNDEVAKRSFSDACHSSNLGLHAKDFELWRIGSFDDELVFGLTDEIPCIYEEKRLLCSASEFFPSDEK